MNVLGVTNFQMLLHIDGKYAPFQMSCLVIDDLSDQLNHGSYFLKMFNVSLEFSNDHPLKLHFKNMGVIQSVGSI